jgi:hypothetical protein
MNESTRAARSVRLFLADGSASGLLTAEVVNWTGKVVAAPRSRLPELLARREAAKTGVYLLAGPDPDHVSRVRAYIGEADSVGKRLRRHDAEDAMDFFDRVAVIVSSDDNLTKAHARVLESQLIRLANEAENAILVNTTAPDFARLPEADLADMKSFVDQLLLVLPIVGFDLFRATIRHGGTNSHSADGSPTFELEAVGVRARAQEIEDAFVVLAGSTARKGATATFQMGYRALRDKLVADGKLVDGAEPDCYRFAADVAFSSPSTAASIVMARSASGPQEWKLAGSSQSYREWRAAQLPG